MGSLFVTVFESIQEYSIVFLNVFAVFSIYFSILTILNKNPIVSILFLICLFIFISGYLLFLGMNFIGIAYLLVYIGAVSVLFLFILMLINIRISEIKNDAINSLPLAILIGFFFFAIFQPEDDESLIDLIYKIFEKLIKSEEKTNHVSSVVWDTNIVEYLHITSIGSIMYTTYFLWLILASIILLLAMVGSIIITIKQKD